MLQEVNQLVCVPAYPAVHRSVVHTLPSSIATTHAINAKQMFMLAAFAVELDLNILNCGQGGAIK